jgi:hypothetical protein
MCVCIERGGDSVGDAGNCSFIPYDAQLLPLADAVVASHASLCSPHTATASTASSSFAGAALQDGVAWALLHSHPSSPTHAPPTPDCLAHMPKALLKGFDWFSSGDSESGESEEPAPRLSRRSRASPPIILNLSHIIATASEGVTAAGMEWGEEDMQHMRRRGNYGGVWLASQVCEHLLAHLPLAPPAASHAPSASPSHAPSASPTGNRIGDAGADSLAAVLTQCAALTHLNVKYNGIGLPHAGGPFANQLSHKGNEIGSDGAQRLRASWRGQARRARLLLL